MDSLKAKPVSKTPTTETKKTIDLGWEDNPIRLRPYGFEYKPGDKYLEVETGSTIDLLSSASLADKFNYK